MISIHDKGMEQEAKEMEVQQERYNPSDDVFQDPLAQRRRGMDEGPTIDLNDLGEDDAASVGPDFVPAPVRFIMR